MTKLTLTAALLALTTVAASAQAPDRAQPTTGPAVQTMTSIPANSMTITHWYKQNVYDPSDNKIGEIEDVLINREGSASALIIGVGGFLGIGEKHVAVPFNAVQVKTKDNNKWYLVMNSTKDALKSAKGFKYDRNAMTWGPEDAATTGGGTRRRRRRRGGNEAPRRSVLRRSYGRRDRLRSRWPAAVMEAPFLRAPSIRLREGSGSSRARRLSPPARGRRTIRRCCR